VISRVKIRFCRNQGEDQAFSLHRPAGRPSLRADRLADFPGSLPLSPQMTFVFARMSSAALFHMSGRFSNGSGTEPA